MSGKIRREKSEEDLVALIEGQPTPPAPDPNIPLVLGKPLYGHGGIYEDAKETQEWADYAIAFMAYN